MKQIFKLLFLLRYIKPTKLQVSFLDYLYIANYYIKNRLNKIIEFKYFYYIIIEESIKQFKSFEDIVKIVHIKIIEKENG